MPSCPDRAKKIVELLFNGGYQAPGLGLDTRTGLIDGMTINERNKECLNCGYVFQNPKLSQQYCSDQCYREYKGWDAKNDN